MMNDDLVASSCTIETDQNDYKKVPLEDLQHENIVLHSKMQALQEKYTDILGKRSEISKSLRTIHEQQDLLTTYKNHLENKFYTQEISELHSLAMRTQSNQDWLALTNKINTLNDCFHIWHRGQYGTINGLRMGGDVPPISIPEECKSKSNSIGQEAGLSSAGGGNSSASSSDYHVLNFSMGLTLQSDLSSHATTDARDSNSENVSHNHSDDNNSNTNASPNSQADTSKINNTSIPGQSNASNSNTKTNHDINVITSSITSDPPSNPHSYNHFKVPWPELNAALGTAALLLTTLEENRNNPIKFHAHKIIPMGSFSKIVLLPIPPNTNKSPNTYNLFSDDSFSLFGKRNFNIALNALLKCLKDAADIASERDKTMVFPHEIGYMDSKGTISSTPPTSGLTYYGNNRDDLYIGGLSISYGADGEKWTRALKYFLTDLKWLVAFVVKHVDR